MGASPSIHMSTPQKPTLILRKGGGERRGEGGGRRKEGGERRGEGGGEGGEGKRGGGGSNTKDNMKTSSCQERNIIEVWTS